MSEWRRARGYWSTRCKKWEWIMMKTEMIIINCSWDDQIFMSPGLAVNIYIGKLLPLLLIYEEMGKVMANSHDTGAIIGISTGIHNNSGNIIWRHLLRAFMAGWLVKTIASERLCSIMCSTNIQRSFRPSSLIFIYEWRNFAPHKFFWICMQLAPRTLLNQLRRKTNPLQTQAKAFIRQEESQ